MIGKILFVPLDDRPCCLQFVERLAAMRGIELVSPPHELLGRFQNPGRPDELRQWYAQQRADVAIVSLDMLAFGGLVASRRPDPDLPVLVERLERWWDAAQHGPPVLAFQSVLRTAPTQTTQEEVELAHKLLKAAENPGQAQDLPHDYLPTRKRNHELNLLAAEWTRQGRFRGLLLGIDDSKTVGWNVLEVKKLSELQIPNVWIAPGTDESAQLLLCRAAARRRQIRVTWSDPALFEQQTLYEDRPLGRLLEAQMRAADLHEDPASEWELYIHGRAGKQTEAAWQPLLPAEDPGGRRMVVADVAYANGGDRALLQHVAPNWLGYSAWNTAGNTLGTALAVLALAEPGTEQRRFLLERLADDLLFQADYRQRARLAVGHAGLTLTPDEKDRCLQLCSQLPEDLRHLAARLGHSPRSIRIDFPWDRLFEIAVEVEA